MGISFNLQRSKTNYDKQKNHIYNRCGLMNVVSPEGLQNILSNLLQSKQYRLLTPYFKGF